VAGELVRLRQEGSASKLAGYTKNLGDCDDFNALRFHIRLCCNFAGAAEYHLMMKRWAAWVLAVGIAVALLARAAAPTSQPSPVQYHEEVRADPPLHLHIVTVDLTDPRVTLRVVRGGDDPDGAGPWQSKLDTVRSMAAREHLAAAVNGNFFTCKDAMSMLGKKMPYYTGNWAMVTGTAMSDGVLWASDLTNASLVVDVKGHVSIRRFTQIPPDARQIASSNELLLVHGKNTATSKDLAPRTAIGIDRDGKKLTMFVVDGRRDDFSVGMTGPQLADELLKFGCYDALLLDGGGSSTMVLTEGDTIRTVNHPSDGHDLPIDMSIDRPVANAVGVVVRDGDNAQTADRSK
jgi:phosphodiester glycosidase